MTYVTFLREVRRQEVFRRTGLMEQFLGYGLKFVRMLMFMKLMNILQNWGCKNQMQNYFQKTQH